MGNQFRDRKVGSVRAQETGEKQRSRVGVTRISVVAEAIGRGAGPGAYCEEGHPTLEGEELGK